MRYFYAFYLLIFLFSCKAKKKITTVKTLEPLYVVCPANGVCTLNTLKNKTLEIRKDNLGSMYPEIIEGNSVVLKFEYIKQGNTEYEDAGYREEIFIELNTNNLELETENLEDQKLFFARWCYCKGQTGYYKIKKGELKVTKLDDKNFQIHLNFEIKEVPQIIKEIKQNFSLE